MQKKAILQLNAVLLGLTGLFFLLAATVGADDKSFFGGDSPENVPQIVKAIDLSGTFEFCGETLPMDNFDVRERLDRELLVNTYWQSNMVIAIKSTRRFFPMMDRILEEEGVPADLKYVAVAESALRNATSSAGAKGLWQFMKGTGGEYGLEISDEVDERNHAEMSTRAAAKYLKSLRNRFGSWANAAAAYNMGGGNMNKNMTEQRTDSYFDMSINEETSRYYFRVVALKYIIENPRKYGFYLESEDYYPALDDYKVVTVSGPVANWGDFAKEHGTTYRMLKIYNPWLVSSKLTNKAGKTYRVYVGK